MSLYDVSKLGGAAPLRGTARDGAARTAAAPAPARPAAVADQGVAVETGTRIAAGQAPVDGDRVAEIRTALREGNYPIVPARITDALIAARLMLSTGQ